MRLKDLYFVTLDIDECETGADDCEQICLNLEGSFECSCSDGYELDENGRNCTGELLKKSFSHFLHCK